MLSPVNFDAPTPPPQPSPSVFIPRSPVSGYGYSSKSATLPASRGQSAMNQSHPAPRAQPAPYQSHPASRYDGVISPRYDGVAHSQYDGIVSPRYDMGTPHMDADFHYSPAKNRYSPTMGRKQTSQNNIDSSRMGPVANNIVQNHDVGIKGVPDDDLALTR